MSRIVDLSDLSAKDMRRAMDADWGTMVGRISEEALERLVKHHGSGAAMFCKAELARREALS